MNDKTKSNNQAKIALILLIIFLIMIMIFIIYKGNGKNNILNDENTIQENTKEEINITSEEVQNLIYPIYNRSNFPYWEYKNITVNELGMYNMIKSSLGDLEYIKSTKEDLYKIYSSPQIQLNFNKIFGPDIPYVTNDIIGDNECEKAIYNKENNTYSINTCIDEQDNEGWNYITKLYKSDKDDENIYVYFYVQPYYCTDEVGCYLYDREIPSVLNAGGDVIGYSKKISETINLEEVNNEVQTMIENNEVDTYKFIFKKQSDGNYYFYSGEWQ